MKKVLAALCVLIVLGVSALCAPIVGIQVEPLVGSEASFSFGYCWDSWQILGTKDNFTTWIGRWGVSVLWTPELDGVELRTGPSIAVYWDDTGVYYNDLAYIIGIQHFWGMVGIYGQLELNSAYGLVPAVGVQIELKLPEKAGE